MKRVRIANTASPQKSKPILTKPIDMPKRRMVLRCCHRCENGGKKEDRQHFVERSKYREGKYNSICYPPALLPA